MQQLGSVIVISLLLTMFQSISWFSAGQDSFSGPNRLLRYEGSLMINMWGEKLIKEYFDTEAYCETPVGYVSMFVRYSIISDVVYDPGAGIYVNSLNFTITQVTVTPDCLMEYLTELGVNETSYIYYNISDFYIDVSIERGNITLRPSRRTGVVVGIVRFDYDTIHVIDIDSYESVSLYRYSRYDLYYEPLTGIPVHYDKTYTELSNKGSIYTVQYATLLGKVELFRDIGRKVYEVVYDENRVNKSATLIILYHRQDERFEPLVKVINSSVFVSFDQPTPCFVQFGPMREQVVGNIGLAYYNVTNGHVYFTPIVSRCSLLNLTIKTQVNYNVHVHEVMDFPEKGVPPNIPDPTISDFASSLVMISLVTPWIYLLIRIIADRLVKLS